MSEPFPVVDLTWDLETIFAGGVCSPEFDEEVRRVSQELARLGGLLDGLPSLSSDVLFELFEARDRLGELRAFASAQAAASGASSEAGRRMNRVEELLAQSAALDVRVESVFRGMGEADFEEFLETPGMEALRGWLSEVRKKADASMEPDLEELAAALCRDGLHAWQSLYRRLAGELSVPIRIDEEVEELSVGQAGVIWRHPDGAKRRALFYGLQEAWGGVATVCAAALNAKVGVEQTLYKRRGEGCLTGSLRFNRIEQSTVDTMMEVAAEFRPLMVRYLNAKARGMGKEQLCWWDLHATLGENRGVAIPYPEAQRFLVDEVAKVHPSMAAFFRFAFASRWVEVENRPEKAAGAFCIGFPRSRQIRVFMTYGQDGLGDLAHELGHGYHCWKLKDQHSAQTFFPMTLAETASILAERIVEQALLEVAKPEEELSLLEKRLAMALGFYVNLPARYELEKAFHRERERGVLDERGLSDLTEEILSAAYGGAVEQVDRLYWASTRAFFDTRYPFYNYPYTFGYFFSHGVHEMARDAGAGFAQRIDELLENSGTMSCEEAGERYLGVDLRAPEFWGLVARSLEADVERFEELVDVAMKNVCGVVSGIPTESAD